MVTTFELKDPLRVSLFYLFICGLYPPYHAPRLKPLFPLMVIVFRGLVVGLFFFPYFIGTWFFFGDTQALLYNSHVNIHYMVSWIKCHCFWKARHELRKLIDLSVDEKLQGKTDEERDVLCTWFRFWRKMNYAYLTAMVITIFWMVTKPMIHGHRGMAFTMWYPFDVLKSPMYELCKFHEFLAIWFVGTSHGNVDSVFGAMMLYVACQCRMLKISLENFAKHTTPETAEETHKRLIAAVEHHQRILV